MLRTLARKNSDKATVLGYDLEGISHVVRKSGRTKKRIAYATVKSNIPIWVLTA